MSNATHFGANRVICDSRQALIGALGSPWPDGATVLTVSPILHAMGDVNSEFLPDRMDARSSLALQSARIPLQKVVHANLMADAEIASFAGTASMSAMQAMNVIGFAAMLQEDELRSPISVIEIETGDRSANSILNGPWRRLLAFNPHASCQTVGVDLPGPFSPRGGAPPSIVARLRQSSWRRVLYRLITRFGPSLPGSFGRGTILIADENEMVQEMAAEFTVRGYLVRTLPTFVDASKSESASSLDRIGHTVKAAVRPIVEKFVADSRLVDTVCDLISERSIGASMDQMAAARRFRGELDRSPRTAFVLSNFPSRPEIRGISEICREAGIPVVGCQHGVSAEICDGHETTFMTYETASADIACVFNPTVAERLNSIPLRRGGAVDVGMPRDLARPAPALSEGKTEYDIGYVSTAVFHGYSGKFQYGAQNDREILEDERNLVKNILSGLQRSVLYKTYPSMRFADANPIPAEAAAAPNIEIYDGETDFRFLRHKCAMLLTSRATSTFSWCLLSGRPVIYLDLRNSLPLRLEVRKAFEQALLVVSTDEPGWSERLRILLEMPLDDIRQMWAEKAADREALLRTIIASSGDGARNAVRHLLRNVGVRRRDPGPASADAILMNGRSQ